MNNTPDTEPTTRPGERDITATWPVGEPSPTGWQALAELYVRYSKGVGYLATLGTLHEQREGISVTRTINASLTRAVNCIHTHPGTRFSRKTLTQVYDAALTELRRRHQAAEETVTPYFDPDSEAFDYPGAPTRR